MTGPLVEFIKARLDEDEREIREFEEFAHMSEGDLSRPRREVQYHRTLLQDAVVALDDSGPGGNWADFVLTNMSTIWASHRDYDPSWGLGVPGSDPQASHGSQDPNRPERPGERRTEAQGARSDHHTPTEEKS